MNTQRMVYRIARGSENRHPPIHIQDNHKQPKNQITRKTQILCLLGNLIHSNTHIHTHTHTNTHTHGLRKEPLMEHKNVAELGHFQMITFDWNINALRRFPLLLLSLE